MRRVYQVLSFGIAGLVVLEIVLGGAAALLSVFSDEEMIDTHRLLGAYLLPVAGLALFLVSFETERKGASLLALAVWVLITLDVVAALVAEGGGVSMMLHAVLGVALLVLSIHAGRRLPTAEVDEKWHVDDAW